MRGVLRYIYKRLLPVNISQSIDVFKHLRMPEVDGLKEKSVLILSPHPDDDIISCGGTMQIYRKRGAEITCVYMTDGRKGNPKYDEDELILIRKEEARRGAGIVGINRLIFLDNRDSELAPAPKTISELTRILKEIKPEAIFLPFLTDNHPDHRATSLIFLSAVKSMPPCTCYMWGIWTPLPTFNLSVDITPYADIKRKALEEHRSQIELFKLVEASFGLSKYYSSISNNGKDGKEWAEVYIVCPSDEYRRLAEVIAW